MAKTKKYRVGSSRPVGPVIAPAIISRVPVFQPRFKNLQNTTITAETAWGSVRIVGKLGGIHRKVLDALFATALDTFRHSTDIPQQSGALSLLVDPYQVAKVAGVATRHPQWLYGILEDMRVARVELHDKTTGGRHWAGIVSEVNTQSSTRVPLPGGCKHGDRPLWRVTISSAWMRIYDTSLVLRYRNALPVLGQITSGATHALALHILTHTGGSYDVPTGLKTVGVPWNRLTQRRQHQLMQEIIREKDHLFHLGMELYRHHDTNHLMISYHPTGDVHAQNPVETTAPGQSEAICAGKEAICAGKVAICAGSQ